MMFLHQNNHKYTSISPDGKTHNQIDHVLRTGDDIQIYDVRSFTGADYDSDHYLVVEKIKERLAVRKQAEQKFYVAIFNLKKLNELEVKRYSNTCTGLDRPRKFQKFEASDLKTIGT
jgi:hypothetical protein